MKNSTRHIRSGLRSGAALCALLTLAACGGGGGGDTSTGTGGGTTTVTPAGVGTNLDENNTREVGSSATKSTLNLGAGNDVGISATGVQVDQVPIHGLSPELLNTIVARADERLAALPNLPVGATYAATTTCANGGKAGLAFDDPNNNRTVDKGDTVVVAFSNCREGAQTLDGTLAIHITALTGKPGSGNAKGRYRLTFDQVFVKIDGFGAIAESGALDLDFTEAGAGRGSATGFSQRFHILEVDGNGATLRDNILTNASRSETWDSSGRRTTTTMTLEGTWKHYSGSLAVTTLQPVFVPRGSYVPTAGAIRLAAPNSNATVTFLTGGVKTELDGNNDGAIDKSYTQTWSEFLADQAQ